MPSTVVRVLKSCTTIFAFEVIETVRERPLCTTVTDSGAELRSTALTVPLTCVRPFDPTTETLRVRPTSTETISTRCPLAS